MKIIGLSPAGNMSLRAGRVFDGFASIPGANIDITVSGGIIREVRPIPRGIAPGPPDTMQALDLREYTVLPAMVDCHVHLALDGIDFNRSLELWSKGTPLWEKIRANLQNALHTGIAAVRDGGDREGIGLRARDKAIRGDFPAPRIKSSGTALGRPGMYGSFLGPGLDGNAIPKAVENLARLGVDQVKALVSGAVSFKKYRRVGPLQFTADELKEIVLEAARHGLKVMAHANSDEAVEMAVQARVGSLEHGYFVSPQSLENMARAGIPWVPTLAPVAARLKEPHRRRHSMEELEIIEKILLRQMKMVKKAAETGVIIGAGSDAGASGVLHGRGLLDEITLLEKAGLSREEILRAVTSGGASVVGLEKEMGMVRPGMMPYLMAVRGNPLEDLRRLTNVEYMILPYTPCP